ncbi:M48 family metallopeptidase [Streptomyces sp. YU58]|uniref:M48 family metallopeptidase n=1 Tax=Streptomyces sp. SX92 TaxID=3158972 RepID=UPI0027B9D5F3|nr:SprT family zinc-dependent metalloprotease [Streptomyces coralus]WLW52788.1 SprT family zinc-dependent metalloprotease [Streptomyces coralus]
MVVSERRRRLGLTVERDGSLVLRAPQGCDAERAETFLREGEAWLADKLRRREEHPPAHPVREFRDGETFAYLGRGYRLRIDGEGQGAVRLVAGRIVIAEVLGRDPVAARRALVGWYRDTGQRWARGRLQPWAARMEVREPDVVVRDVGNRWGTFRVGDGARGTMALHWALFQLPAHLVDYVIAHELAHIRISGHGADYWSLLRQAIPECEERKRELDDLGRRLWLGDIGQQG